MFNYQDNPKSPTGEQSHTTPEIQPSQNSRSLDEQHHLSEMLAHKAQQSPRKSQKRRIALTQMMGAIAQSGKLYSQDRYQVSVEVYNEALAVAFLEVCQKIENYDSAKGGPCAWVNQLLDEQLLNGLNR